MTHIILLDDGKIWAFEPPEKLKSPTIGQSVEYERAYYRALEQKIEVENVDDVQRWLNSRGIIFMAPNEPIKWEGEVQIIGVGHNGEFKTKYERTVVRLIAQVKEEPEYVHLTEKDKDFIELTKVPDGAFQAKPVPSEQEKTYTREEVLQIVREYDAWVYEHYRMYVPNGKRDEWISKNV